MTEQWRVKIERGSITVDASSASEARREAIQAFAEDLSLFSVAPDDGLVEIEVSPTTRRMLDQLAKQLNATPESILEEAIRTYALDV